MAISAATDLSEQTRRHWRSSLTGIAKAFDQPLELIPARYSAIRARMAALHHVPLDWVPKTLANHKSNAKAALIWFAKEKDVLPHGVPLSPAWDRLRVQLTDPSTRYRLMPLMRFCSGVHIEPEAVDEAVIDRYMDHRARTTSACQRCRKPANFGAAVECRHRQDRRLAADASRRAAGEGRRRPGMGRLPGGPSHGHRRLSGWPQPHPPEQGRTAQPALQTIDNHNRKRELVAAVRMAVKVGVPLDSLTSLSALIHPDVAEKILDGYWRKDGEVPKTYTINLSCRFVALAHAIGGLDEDALRRLGDARFALEQHREDGMTPKNLALIRLRAYGWGLVAGREPARAAHAASPAAAAARAGQGRGPGPDRRRGGDPDGGAGPAGQSCQHSSWREPDQARRTAVQLLADVPQVRRQEQGRRSSSSSMRSSRRSSTSTCTTSALR